ncbi:MAG: hypothetical protein KC731_38290, partial [Myxococcales bacterium]|nr:hypothetical protein [Myxococcales bacterium]
MKTLEPMARRAVCDAHGLAVTDDGGCVLCHRELSKQGGGARGGGSWLSLVGVCGLLAAVFYLGSRPVPSALSAGLARPMALMVVTLAAPPALVVERAPRPRKPRWPEPPNPAVTIAMEALPPPPQKTVAVPVVVPVREVVERPPVVKVVYLPSQ